MKTSFKYNNKTNSLYNLKVLTDMTLSSNLYSIYNQNTNSASIFKFSPKLNVQ